MINFKIKKSNLFSFDFKFIQRFCYGTKNYLDILKRDTEIYNLTSGNKRPRQNLLSVMGFVSSGALGVKKMINGERRNGNLVNARRPYPLYFFNVGRDISVKDVACGYGFTLFSGRNKSNWEVYGCGLNNDSQIGFHNVPLNSQGDQIIMEPHVINISANIDKITHIACGRAHSIIVADVSCADKDTQVIYSLGNNLYGQCGREIINNEVFLNNTIVHNIQFNKRIKQVECGEWNTYLLTEDGIIYACGNNRHGQLLRRDVDRSSVPLKLEGCLNGKVVKQISSRFNTVMALTMDGEVWAWGDNEHSLVFTESENSAVTTPQHLYMPKMAGKIVYVSAGNTVCGVVDEYGKIFTWGQFLLGLGPSCELSLEPKMIPEGLFGAGLSTLNGYSSKVVSVHCGLKHCLAITSSGSLYFWGEGGVVKNGNQTFPVKMPLTFNAKRAFVGADHSVIMGGLDF